MTEIRRKGLTAVVGTQWMVLSVLILFLMSFAMSGLTDRPMPVAARIGLLLGAYLVALCLPGLILLRTSFKDETRRIILICTAFNAVVLTLFRMLGMFAERFDCGRDCANSLPYHTEVLVSFSLPFLLVLTMYLLTLVFQPRHRF